jgi:hypothetical protein
MNEQSFFKGRSTKGQKTHGEMLNIPGHKEMQIKMTLRSHLTLVRMAVITNTSNNKCWQRCGEKGILRHCWKKYKCIITMETICQFLRKLKIELSYDPLLGIYLKESKSGYNKDTSTPCLLQHYSQ